MINEILLGLANFLTSAMTAITGLGGGMLLIGLMPLFVPAAAIIPVHAVTQLVSNGSRAWFGRKYIQFEHLAAFIFGSLLGMGLFGTFIQWLELQWIPFFIGLYILLIQWSQHFNRWIRKFEHFFWVGFLQTGLGVFVGTPGPLNIAVLNKHYDDPHIVVSTGALMMSVVHTAKLLVYIALGFSFIEYWRLLVFMMVMAVVGSWFGTLLRHKIRMDWIKKVLPYLLSILAIKLMISVVWEQWF